MMTEPIVMPMPTRAAITTVRGDITVPVDGNPAPAALKPAMSSLATRTPPTRPRIVAIRPRMNDSTVIIRRTCRPDAPTARINASSRSR